MSARRHSSDERSQTAAASVTAVHINPRTLPAVGEIEVTRASTGYKATFNTGTRYGCFEAYGPTEEAAEANVLERAARFGITREDALDIWQAQEPSLGAFDDEFDDFGPETEIGMEDVGAEFEDYVAAGRR